MKYKNIVKVVCAALIFVLCFNFLGKLFEPKWNYYGNQSQTRVQAFYEQEENTMDVIYLGASYTYCGVSPLEIYKEQGITGYDLCNPMQKAWISKAYLEEAFKTQSPKVVVYEVGPIFDEEEGDEGHNRKNIDYMKWSGTKLEAIKEIVTHTDESWKDYLFPFLRFHSRWSDLKKADFNLSVDKDYYFMGTALKMSTRPSSDEDIAIYEAFAPKADAEKKEVGPRAAKAIQEMKQLCEKNGATLQLVRMSSMLWTKEESDAVEAFAKEQDLSFLDMNDPENQKKVGVDWKVDSHDAGQHVNILGCKKTSSFLGKYLKENYQFETNLAKGTKNFWDESAAKFSNLIDAYSMPVINDLKEYMTAATNEDFITVLALHGSIGEQVTDETRTALKQLGVSLPETGSKDAYVAVLKGKANGTFEVVKELRGDSKQKITDLKLDGINISATSKTAGELKGKIQIDGVNYSLNKAGLNIVLYDQTLQQPTDVAVFNTAEVGGPAEHTEQMLVEDEGGE